MKPTVCFLSLLCCCTQGIAQKDDGRHEFSSLPRGVRVTEVRPAQLDAFEKSGNYVHVETGVLSELLQRMASSSDPSESPVERAEFNAVLSDRSLKQGTLTLTLVEDAAASRRNVSLGETNLDRLHVYSEGRALTIASNSRGEVIPLIPPVSQEITGTWEATGTVVGKATEFTLRLPVSSVAIFHLRTNRSTSITSTNSLVTSSLSDTHIDWDLYPRDPSSLHISSETRELRADLGDVVLATSARVRIDAEEASVTWDVAIPAVLERTRIDFRVSKPCRVSAVRLENSSRCEWDFDSSANVLHVTIPELLTASKIIIDAVITTSEHNQVEFPILNPESWKSTFGEAGGNAEVRFDPVQVVVSPELMVTDLRLDGLLQHDIAFRSDGSQTLDLRQFRRDASATVFLTPATPVVTDSVIIRVGHGESAGTATAYVFVSAQAGTLGDVRWSLPRSWRVTEMRALASGQPVLFRMKTPQEASEFADVDAVLRNPVSVDSGQGIVVQMQSTDQGTSAVSDIPMLINDDYHRRTDLLCLAAEHIGEEKRWNGIPVTTLPTAEVLNAESWLPAEEFNSTVLFFERPRKNSAREQTGKLKNQLYATVDYSASSADDVVTESLRIRLRTADEFPEQIPIQTTPAVEFSVSATSVTQPAPTIRESPVGLAGNWLLEIPVELQSTHEIDVTLVCQRTLDDRMPAALVLVPTARLTGGTIRPADSDQIVLSRSQPVLRPEEYPEKPFDDGLRLVRSQPSESRLNVSATAFIQIRDHNDGFSLEGLQRIAVDQNRRNNFLSVKLPSNRHYSILVDGRPVFANEGDNQVQIPLQNDARQSVVTIGWTADVSGKSEFPLQLATCPDASSSKLGLFVLTPVDYVVELPVRTLRHPAAHVTQLLTGEADFDASDFVESFQSRWQLAALDVEQILFADVSNSSISASIRLQSTKLDLPQLVCWTVLFAWVWRLLDSYRLINRWIPFVVFVGIVPLSVGTDLLPEVLHNGFVAGTLIFGLLRIGNAVKGRHLHRPPDNAGKLSLRLTGLIIFAAICQTSMGYDENADPQILLPFANEGRAPFAYVRKEFLAELKNTAANNDAEAFVVSSTITVTMESEQSCLATVECLVACDPGSPGALKLPLTGLTLVNSLLDGKSVFPGRGPAGETIVNINSSAVLPNKILEPQTTAESSMGPGTIGSWDLRRVEYTIRAVPRRTPAEYRLQFEFPPSATASVIFRDTSGLVEEVSGSNDPESIKVDTTGAAVRFPAVFNTRNIELALRIKNAASGIAEILQQCSVVCLADLTPNQQRITCEYKLRPADSKLERVVVNVDPRFRTTRVELANAAPALWSQEADQLVIAVTPNADGVQEFLVEQIRDPSTRLIHELPIGRLSTVNNLRATAIALLPKTSDQYFVKSTVAAQQELSETLLSAEVRTFSSSRNAVTMISVPVATDSVTVALAELQATRVARLKQNVLVTDDTVEWNLRCEIDVTGQPILRQSLNISSDLKIIDVSASSNGVSRLQSWTRHDDLVVLALREPTREALTLQITGQIERPPNQNCALPVIGLPEDIHITESELEIAAESEIDTFISDLGSARPDDPLDVDNTPIGRTQLRMDLRDEAHPLVIRGNAEKLVTSDAAVLIYESAGEMRYALFLNLKTPNAAFDIHFRCPQPQFGDQRPILIHNGEATNVGSTVDGFAIPRSRITVTDGLILAFADIPVATSGTSLTCPVPKFSAEISYQACTAFDLRVRTGSAASERLPDWVSESAVFLGITNDLMQCRPVDCRYRDDSQQLQLQPSPEADAPRVTTDSTGKLLVHGQHMLTSLDNDRITGTAGFMVFRSLDAPVRIVVSPDVTIVELRVDGQLTTVAVVDGSILLRPENRVAFINVSWFHQGDADPAQQQNVITVPSIPAALSFSSAFIAPANSQRAWWSVDSKRLTYSDVHNAANDSFRRGIRLVEPGAETVADESDVGVGGISMANWKFIATESTAAASLGSAFFQHSDNAISTTDGIIADLNNADSFAISSTAIPAPGTSLTVVAGLILLVMTFVKTKRPDRGNTSAKQRQEDEAETPRALTATNSTVD